jgi:hypothetical protein
MHVHMVSVVYVDNKLILIINVTETNLQPQVSTKVQLWMQPHMQPVT